MLLRLFNNWFAPTPSPIGVDFGSDSLRLAQVQLTDGEPHLIAAASADVPSAVRHDPAGRMAFFAQSVRELLAGGNFRGRRAVLCLPSASMFIQHLRMPRMDEEATRKALPWEARGKLPIDPSHAVLRHLVAGEVYQEQEPRNEIIVMAAARELVNLFIDAAARAKLDVIGMNVEPLAVVNCFSHIYRRKTDSEVTNCFVDIGYSGTRAFVTRGEQVLFARSIPIGGEHFTRAVAEALKISFEDARLVRVRLADAAPAHSEREDKREISEGECQDSQFAALSAALKAGGAEGQTPAPEPSADPQAVEPNSNQANAAQLETAEQACHEPLTRLVEELDLCRRYYEATFPNKPVDRLIFVGGEARQRTLCQYIAQQLGLAAQVGDPLVRMGRVSEVGIESGIDRRQPQPAWTVAIGLSLGPAAAAAGGPASQAAGAAGRASAVAARA